MLCSNRFPLQGHPSTCTLDSAIVPLPSFLLILALLVRLALHAAAISNKRNLNLSQNKESTLPNEPQTGRQSQDKVAYLPRWLSTTYILLILAALGMNVVQIARLIKAKEGVGLLPVILVALLLVIAVLQDPYRVFILIPYWLLSIIFVAVDLTRLKKLDAAHPAKDTQYPSSDKVVDNAVLIGLYASFLCFELWVLYQMKIRAPQLHRQQSQWRY